MSVTQNYSDFLDDLRLIVCQTFSGRKPDQSLLTDTHTGLQIQSSHLGLSGGSFI